MGLVLAAAGFLLPTREFRVAAQTTALDRHAPAWQFSEVHDVEIASSPMRVYRAVREVTADEIALFRTLTAIRRFGRSGPESILDPPRKRPILDVATSAGFRLLADDAGREIVISTKVIPPPHRGEATMNFLIEELRPGLCRLRTETRVHLTGDTARRLFAPDWRVIYPGSSLIRHMWLRAIAVRAAEPPPPTQN